MDAVSRWLARVAAERGPVVVVLDDLQWADESSLALLEFVARDPTPAAIALLGCYRHDELAPTARRRLSRLAMSASSVELGGLDRAAVEVLAAEIAGPFSADEVDELYRRAGGHPVFTRELALLAREGQGGHLVPVAVRDAIEHRLAGLPRKTRELLEVAALAGNAIAVDVLAAAASTPRLEVDAALAEDRLAGVVSVDLDDRLQFAHDLYRETITASIRGERRVALHQELGIALAERAAGGLPVHPADLAHHFTASLQAGDVTRAAEWALAAAAADVRSLAFGGGRCAPHAMARGGGGVAGRDRPTRAHDRPPR